MTSYYTVYRPSTESGGRYRDDDSNPMGERSEKDLTGDEGYNTNNNSVQSGAFKAKKKDGGANLQVQARPRYSITTSVEVSKPGLAK